MYKNIGEKVKRLAVVMAVLSGIGAFVGGLLMIAVMGEAMVAVGFLVALGGPVAAVWFSWPLYAFGELVSQATSINEKLDGVAGGSVVKEEQKKEDIAQRKEKLAALLASGAITESEYHLALSKM